jgi:hypothetical protein
LLLARLRLLFYESAQHFFTRNLLTQLLLPLLAKLLLMLLVELVLPRCNCSLYGCWR